MIIVLLGYMGSGKSTVGKELATVLDYDFIDLDDYISQKEGETIPEIFNTKGEIYFRKKETEYLSEILKNSKPCVLALGGGTPCYGNNMNLILESNDTESIYLRLKIPTLVNRLSKEVGERPLINHLQNENELVEYIGKHLFERNEFYSKANYTLDCDNLSVKEIVEQIVLKLI